MKAILVIDMPENCFGCYVREGNCCLGRYINPDDYGKRSSWCPLKQMPEKCDIKKAKTITVENWIKGWNACVEKIERGD